MSWHNISVQRMGRNASLLEANMYAMFPGYNITTGWPPRDNNSNNSGYFDQVTVNGSDRPELLRQYNYHEPKYEEPVMIVICIFLGCMILAIILGNIFVITAILVEKSLQGVSNYLILSLAVTDLLVAVLVMPLSLIYEISIHWFLGNAVCDMWVSMDVLCCTASILHLVAIAFDRYWAVSNIDYVRSRNARQILLMVAIVWTVSVFISISPLFGWRHDSDDPELTGQCLISQDHGYTVFSTVGRFYCPLLLMLVINFKIYRAARYRIRKKRFGGRGGKHQALHVPLPAVTVDTSHRQILATLEGDVSQDGISMYMPSCTNAMTSTRVEHGETARCPGEWSTRRPAGSKPDSHVVQHTDRPSMHLLASPYPVQEPRSRFQQQRHQKTETHRQRVVFRREKMEMARERKVWLRVLGIITGAFVVCWLPFFVVAVVKPMCGTPCDMPSYVYSLFLWLGYVNSLINPIIYTIFNPSFRCAFNKIFLRRIKSVNRIT
uniref:G-protein-coupled 5-hydroxytryptamine receptor n=1 Tax=Aplysia californica TaxID=6500 RepID=O76267_APLCA|nr:G-protein-coupled 5-hydroxytryptamine receptor [Aplysia californica]AAC28786.1 G-protein-coupled 5-hydroxytryptamine receptor [Aplysia californica]